MALHWSCSEILRTPLMRRTAFMVLVLMVLPVAGAPGWSAVRPKHPAKAAVPQASSDSPSKNDSLTKKHRKALKKAERARRHATARKKPGIAVLRVNLPRTRVPLPPPLRGSYASLERQNLRAEEVDGLERIEDEDDLADRIARKVLVPVPASGALAVNGELPENHRYCRPWTARFLSDLSRVHGALFHKPLVVTSAVRPVDYQKQLMETNGNATAAEGEIVSPHVTGATIDIAKQGLTRQEMSWMRARLLALEKAGKIDVEEEFQQACFHITVYKSYLPAEPAGSGKPKRRVPVPPAQMAARGR